MLKSLFVKNYALINHLEIDFNPGFSVITGETGAGKSIIIGALSLILGQRADIKAIKDGEAKCVVEGTFDVSAYDLKAFCEENSIDYDPQTYILRREILATGKSRAFINDTPVSLNELKLLGEQLIDIHSQHKNLLLGDNRFQMQVVDILAGTRSELKAYQETYKACKSAQKALSALLELSQKSKADEDYLRFQFNALSDAKLTDGEQEALEQEQEILVHAEEIKSALYGIYNSLSGDERNLVQQLKENLTAARSLLKIYPAAESIAQRLECAYLDLKDLSPDIEHAAENIEYDPERLTFIGERLDLIYGLQQKHRVSSIAELLDIFRELGLKIEALESFDEQIENLQKTAAQKETEMLALADDLSAKRKEAVKSIEEQLIAKVSALGMPNVRFECEIMPKEPDSSGIDNLRFLFSANRNTPLLPISDVASGGEISRVMLCLKSMIAGATALPSIIFDEIDTGVSGDIADKMGQIMQAFGRQMQVIAITHLPQIAARGITHYFVYKTDNEDGAITRLKQLTAEERIRELAQMLSGSEITEAAIQNAKAMLMVS
ncbi:MAG: DNA repair protein RecN [Prevotella sp.]|jgi:DNA repair protein RecN (Recombination protein N)|nr:DNA repair protein RecN [Prevotella sp.]